MLRKSENLQSLCGIVVTKKFQSKINRSENGAMNVWNEFARAAKRVEDFELNSGFQWPPFFDLNASCIFFGNAPSTFGRTDTLRAIKLITVNYVMCATVSITFGPELELKQLHNTRKNYTKGVDKKKKGNRINN